MSAADAGLPPSPAAPTKGPCELAAFKALICLYLEVPVSVADDVSAKVRAAFDELRSREGGNPDEENAKKELDAIRLHLRDAGLLPSLRTDGSFVNPATLVMKLWEQRDQARAELASREGGSSPDAEGDFSIPESALHRLDALGSAIRHSLIAPDLRSAWAAEISHICLSARSRERAAALPPTDDEILDGINEKVYEFLQHGALVLCVTEDGDVGVWRYGEFRDDPNCQALAADSTPDEALYAAALRAAAPQQEERTPHD